MHIVDTKIVNQDLVSLLKEFLAEAEAGELQCVAIAGLYHDGSTQSAWQFNGRLNSLLGEISVLQHTMLLHCVDKKLEIIE